MNKEIKETIKFSEFLQSSGNTYNLLVTDTGRAVNATSIATISMLQTLTEDTA